MIVCLDANVVIYLVEANPIWAPKATARLALLRAAAQLGRLPWQQQAQTEHEQDRQRAQHMQDADMQLKLLTSGAYQAEPGATSSKDASALSGR